MAQINDNIYSRIRPADLMGAAESGLKMREGIDQRNKKKQLDQAYQSGVVKNADGSMSYDGKKTASALLGGGFAKEGMEMQSQMTAQNAAQQKLQRESQDREVELVSRVAGGIKDQATYEQGLGLLSQQGVDISKMPKAYDANLVNGYKMRATGYLDQQKLKQQEIDNQFGREEIGVKRTESQNKREEKTTKDKELSVTQAKQLGLYKQGEEAERQFIAATSKKGWGRFDPSSSFNIIDKNDWAPKIIRSKESIEAESAQSRWIEAFLRDASGAAIPPDERGAYAVDFFPMAGDSKQVVADKAAARRVKMDSAKNAAYGGAPPPSQKTVTANTFKGAELDWAD